jgi:hypothetical protein
VRLPAAASGRGRRGSVVSPRRHSAWPAAAQACAPPAPPRPRRQCSGRCRHGCHEHRGQTRHASRRRCSLVRSCLRALALSLSRAHGRVHGCGSAPSRGLALCPCLCLSLGRGPCSAPRRVRARGPCRLIARRACRGCDARGPCLSPSPSPSPSPSSSLCLCLCPCPHGGRDPCRVACRFSARGLRRGVRCDPGPALALAPDPDPDPGLGCDPCLSRALRLALGPSGRSCARRYGPHSHFCCGARWMWSAWSGTSWTLMDPCLRLKALWGARGSMSAGCWPRISERGQRTTNTGTTSSKVALDGMQAAWRSPRGLCRGSFWCTLPSERSQRREEKTQPKHPSPTTIFEFASIADR